MEIISVVPRGYCQGVVRAIKIAQDTAEKYPDQPITMLGMIVHNQFVVDACKHLGIQFVEDKTATRFDLLDQIDTGVVIFTAHGVCDEVKKKACEKGLICVDATCKDVLKTHDLVKQHTKKGDVIYIGKKNHPESEGTVGLSDKVHLVTCTEDIQKLPDLKNVLITNQTTLSILDTKVLIDKCKKRFPDAKEAEEICNATRIRQQAVLDLSSKHVDLLIVVGDPKSNNSRQLAETGKKANIPDVLLISSIEDLQETHFKDKQCIAVTSGSSTPNSLTKQVIETLQKYAKTGVFTPVKASVSIL